MGNRSLWARRTPLLAAGAMLSITALVGCAAGEGDTPTPSAPADGDYTGQTLTIAAYSALFNEEWAKSFGSYFEEKTGAEVVWLESSPSQAIAQAVAAGGSPSFDMMLVDPGSLAQSVKSDVIEPINKDAVPNLANVPDSLRLTDAGVPTMSYRYGLCYNTEEFERLGMDPPSTAESWDESALAGRIMVPSTTSSMWFVSVPALSEALGNSIDDPQPSVDYLSSLDPYGFFNGSGDVDAAMTNGDVWLAVSALEGRCLRLKGQGLPVEFLPWEMTIDGEDYTNVLVAENIVLMKGAKNVGLAELFMNELLSDEGAAAAAGVHAFISSTPPTDAGVAALLELDPAASEWMIDDFSDHYLPDYSKFLPHVAAWNLAWNGML